jgi:hypothetical protein
MSPALEHSLELFDTCRYDPALSGNGPGTNVPAEDGSSWHDRLGSGLKDLERLTAHGTKRYETSNIKPLIQSATDQKVRGSNPFVRTR